MEEVKWKQLEFSPNSYRVGSLQLTIEQWKMEEVKWKQVAVFSQ